MRQNGSANIGKCESANRNRKVSHCCINAATGVSSLKRLSVLNFFNETARPNKPFKNQQIKNITIGKCYWHVNWFRHSARTKRLSEV